MAVSEAMEIQGEATGDLPGRVYEFCCPRKDFQVPSNPSDRIRLDSCGGRWAACWAGLRLPMNVDGNPWAEAVAIVSAARLKARQLADKLEVVADRRPDQ